MNNLSFLDLCILIFEFWIQTNWYIAFLMSLFTNLTVYLVGAYVINAITQKVTKNSLFGKYIDNRPFKRDQRKYEIKNGIIACIIFSLVGLLPRKLFVAILPLSVTQLLIEILVFILFYETYSYLIHRLLHTKLFLKPHFVHHYSIRISSWTAYSIHPIEAFLIAMSAPLFMLLYPMHLSVIFMFHILGLVFTLIIHSNLKLNGNNILCQVFNRYTEYHCAHHTVGNINFGFINSFWDRCFKNNVKTK